MGFYQNHPKNLSMCLGHGQGYLDAFSFLLSYCFCKKFEPNLNWTGNLSKEAFSICTTIALDASCDSTKWLVQGIAMGFLMNKKCLWAVHLDRLFVGRETRCWFIISHANRDSVKWIIDVAYSDECTVIEKRACYKVFWHPVQWLRLLSFQALFGCKIRKLQ